MSQAFELLYRIGFSLQQFGSVLYNFLVYEIDLSFIGLGSVSFFDLLFGSLFWWAVGVSVATYFYRQFVQ